MLKGFKYLCAYAMQKGQFRFAVHESSHESPCLARSTDMRRALRTLPFCCNSGKLLCAVLLHLADLAPECHGLVAAWAHLTTGRSFVPCILSRQLSSRGAFITPCPAGRREVASAAIGANPNVTHVAVITVASPRPR